MFSLNQQKKKTLEEKMRIEQIGYALVNYDLAVDGQKIERVKLIEFQKK